MQFLLDHIAAVVITGFIILILAAISFRGQTSSIDSVQYYAQKRNLLDLVQWTERDFTNIGAGVVPVTSAIQAGDLDTTGTAACAGAGMQCSYFQFRARADSSDAAPSLIRYEWEQVGTHELDAGTVPAYAVRRFLGPAAGPANNLSGQSAGYISAFRIDFFAKGGTPVAPEVDSMRVVRVDVKAVSPLGPTENIQQSQWTKVFRPVNLTRPN
jgi:hypothetical protein